MVLMAFARNAAAYEFAAVPLPQLGPDVKMYGLLSIFAVRYRCVTIVKNEP